MTELKRRALLMTLAAGSAAGMLNGCVAGSKSRLLSTKRNGLRGVVYDVGLNFSGATLSVDPFDPTLVEYDCKTIAHRLNANAIRIEGEKIDRLVTTARIAHREGLTVLFNPWKIDADADELRIYYADAARHAEQLRKEGVDIIFVAGCEYPIFQKGILPGDTLAERLAGLGKFFGGGLEEGKAKMAALWPTLNGFLKSFVEAIRPEFSGPVSYAATQFEQVDWSIFDIVGVDHYRGQESAKTYVEEFKKYEAYTKPVFCMEVGSCTYVGAAKLGGGGFMILEGMNPDGSGRFKGGLIPTRSETEQADYVETQVKLLDGADADGIFVYVFSFPSYPHDLGAKDLDMVAYALVKTFPKEDPRSKLMPPWEPKESFHRLASVYAELERLSA